MKYNFANMKSIKADIPKGEITVSFVVGLNQETLAVSQDLSLYTDGENGTVEISIVPRQLKLKGLDSVTVELSA